MKDKKVLDVCCEPKEITLEDVKNMSWREFKKWKRGDSNEQKLKK